MTFYLQQPEKNGRWIIDSNYHFGAYGDVRKCDASEWLEAKELFGYPLSPVQGALLAKHQSERTRLAA